MAGLDSAGSRHSAVACCCEHGNPTSGSMKNKIFFGQQFDYHLINKDYVPES
jgi:hypothetical protein